MGNFYESIPPNLISWILAQKIFFVASAPLSPSGHINVSPKGGAAFGVASPTSFWYQELTGSGNETISHLYEPRNGRICIMLCAFTGPPRILRLWGHGRVLECGTRAFDEFVTQGHAGEVDVIPGTRSVIVVDVHQVGTSCGFSVPFYEFVGNREVLNDLWKNKEKRWAEGKEEAGMPKYWAYKNAWSMDGLPGMVTGLKAAKDFHVEPITKMVGWAGENLAYAGAGVGVGGEGERDGEEGGFVGAGRSGSVGVFDTGRGGGSAGSGIVVSCAGCGEAGKSEFDGLEYEGDLKWMKCCLLLEGNCVGGIFL